MRIATFNINNVNKRLPNLLDWLAADQPDVVCLQELKCEARAFPIAEIEAAGHGAVWQGQRSWNGVAIRSGQVAGAPPKAAEIVGDDRLTGRGPVGAIQQRCGFGELAAILEDEARLQSASGCFVIARISR